VGGCRVRFGELSWRVAATPLLTPQQSLQAHPPHSIKPINYRGPAGVALSAAGTVWSAVTAAKVLGRMSPALQDVKTLMIYPCMLMYGSFALLGVY